MIKRKHTPDYTKRASIGFAMAAAAFIGWIIYTTPAPYVDVDGAPNAAEEDFYYMSEAGLIGYDELFPPGNEYGKDGEVVESTPNVFYDGAPGSGHGDEGGSGIDQRGGIYPASWSVDEPPAFIIFLTMAAIIIGLRK